MREVSAPNNHSTAAVCALSGKTFALFGAVKCFKQVMRHWFVPSSYASNVGRNGDAGYVQKVQKDAGRKYHA